MRVVVAGMMVVGLFAGVAQAEVVCVRVKKDGTLSGALKVRTECKKREVQVDAAVLGLCCDPFSTTSSTTSSTTMTSTTGPVFTTSTLVPGTTSTSIPGATTSTSSSIVTTTVTIPFTTTSTSLVTTTVTFVFTTTSTSTVTTTSLMCPPFTTTTVNANNCGGSVGFCNGLCANAKQCVSIDGISCACDGPIQPCGFTTQNGQCGGVCAPGSTCTPIVFGGADGCPISNGCGCVPQ